MLLIAVRVYPLRGRPVRRLVKGREVIVVCNRNSQITAIFVCRVKLCEKERRVLAIRRTCSWGHVNWLVQVKAFVSKDAEKAIGGVEA